MATVYVHVNCCSSSLSSRRTWAISYVFVLFYCRNLFEDLDVTVFPKTRKHRFIYEKECRKCKDLVERHFDSIFKGNKWFFKTIPFLSYLNKMNV